MAELYLDLARRAQPDYPHDIVLVNADGRLRELNKPVEPHKELRFVTTAERDGILTYERSALMLLSKAVYDVIGPGRDAEVYVKFSVINGYYAELRGSRTPDAALVARIRERMEELVAADIPFVKKKVDVREARACFDACGMEDKWRLFRYRLDTRLNVYFLEDYVDYYYGYMLPSTGYLKVFDLVPYEKGMALLLPDMKSPETPVPFNPQPKIFRTLQSSSDWSESMGIDSVAEINDKIARGELTDLILMCEARQEADIAAIARQIADRGTVKFVMIAGPSSSGKTSFSHRLSVQLRGMGLCPHPIAVDNYFVDRGHTPVDEFGKPDFECIGAVDTEQFNRDMVRLMQGERVELPSFNFMTGEREYKGNFLQIGPSDILVIEGIHGLNDAMSYAIPSENKFKIYISALTQTNIDEHNRIPSTDGRLIRRIVRDARTRGYSAKKTIGQWSSVRRGEKRNIFPYQESADAVFNSALVYEFSVLKSYAEQQLFAIGEDEPEYLEARRLLKFLNYFLAVDSTVVPQNSLLREFVGGSIFSVG